VIGETLAAEAQEAFSWAAIDKLLVSLHAGTDIAAFWKASQSLIQTAVPECRLGITLQNNSPLTIANDWTCQIPSAVFETAAFENFIGHPPAIKVIRIIEVFGRRNALVKSAFYRRYMMPNKSAYTFFLVFRKRHAVSCIMTILRTLREGELNGNETKLLHRLHPHFQTALHRLADVERDHAARSALQEIVRRLPLAMIVLRWNLEVTYQNPAAREFCTVWENGRELARVLKGSGAVPEAILNGCRGLQKRWKQSLRLAAADRHIPPHTVHCPKLPEVRVMITLMQPPAHGIANPHFLIECEDRHHGQEHSTMSPQQLPHLARLTPRERELTRLLCDGHSNQEIADAVGLSLAMVKKHFHSIFRKLELASRAQLMALMR
jgi:DNA-binding CsgD family transcriptional regulator